MKHKAAFALAETDDLELYLCWQRQVYGPFTYERLIGDEPDLMDVRYCGRRIGALTGAGRLDWELPEDIPQEAQAVAGTAFQCVLRKLLLGKRFADAVQEARLEVRAALLRVPGCETGPGDPDPTPDP